MVGRQLAAQLARRTPFRCGRRDPAQASNSVRFDFVDSLSFRLALCDFDRVFLLRPPQLARAGHDFGPFITAMQPAGVWLPRLNRIWNA